MTTLDDYTRRAAELDLANPLAAARSQFDLPDNESYFLGNSLGPLTHAARAAVVHTLDEEWRNGLVRTWHDGDWLELAGSTGDLVARVIGAPAGSVVKVGDAARDVTVGWKVS